HTVTSMDEIPLGARGWVRVQDPAVKQPISQYVYVADLRHADKQGRFPYRVLTRERFQKGAALPEAGTPSGMGQVAGVGRVVLYSRPGCGACDSARAYLTQRGVKFEEKNVQADESAAKELAAMAAKKGFPTGVVPVIEVHGEIVVGLDVRKLERLLRRRI
ncbi:MAG: glutaredoxin domain-containing protein, partial [bacterium]